MIKEYTRGELLQIFKVGDLENPTDAKIIATKFERADRFSIGKWLADIAIKYFQEGLDRLDRVNGVYKA
jgi:hypothetical protein